MSTSAIHWHIARHEAAHVKIEIAHAEGTVTMVLPADACDQIASVLAREARLSREIPHPPTPKHPKLKLVR